MRSRFVVRESLFPRCCRPAAHGRTHLHGRGAERCCRLDGGPGQCDERQRRGGGQAKPTGGFFQAVLWPSGSSTPTALASVIGQPTSVANGINDAGHLTTVAGFDAPGNATGRTAHFWNGTTLSNIGKLGLGTGLRAS